MNYNTDEMGPEMRGSFELPVNLPFENANFSGMRAWSSSSAGLMYNLDESLKGLNEFDDTFQGLGQSCLGYRDSIQQGSGGVIGEGPWSCYEPLQLLEPAISPVQFSHPHPSSSSLSPVLSSPSSIREVALQPLLERIEALEAAQSTRGVQTPSSSSQSSSIEDRSPRAISRIASPRISRSARERPPPKVHKCKYLPCDVVSSSSKDLKRHELQVHEKPELGMLRLGWYACQCSYSTSRKDDLKRHFRTCKKEPLCDGFACRCLGLFNDRHDFEKHIAKCGGKLRGRPKQPSV